MLRTDDTSALSQIRNYFDSIGYRYILRWGSDIGLPLLYPDFRTLQSLIKSINPIYGLAFALFRQGHPADEAVLRQALTPATFEAMVSTGLLVQNSRRQWKTPGLIITPIEGLYIASSTPPQYPTATTRKHPVYLGVDSLWLISALPTRLQNLRVLDICAGSGIQGLVCAARGARQVVGLEKSELAAEVANFNAALNGFADVVEVRQSDLYSALKKDETFDFFVSNPPFMPVMEDVDYPIPGAGGADGTRLLRDIFAGLPSHLAETAEGFLICFALGDRYSININRDILRDFAREHGLHIRAWVSDKSPTSAYMEGGLDLNLRNTCPEVKEEERQQKIASWYEGLKEQGIQADYTYWQILHFRKTEEHPGLLSLPFYNPVSTDPLVALTALPGDRSR